MKVEAQNLTFQKIQFGFIYCLPVGALINQNNKTSSKGCGHFLYTHKYPFYGVILATSDVALKNPNVRMMDF